MTSKRIFDVLLSTCGLIVLIPVLVVIAVVITATSPGPALFRQERTGLHGKTFRILKFRTMRADAAGEDPGITAANDPRITTVGRWLRRHKLDELPQLINILWGDMSFVGPRPELPEYVRLYPAEVRDKVLAVRPGLTDFAALEFRDEAAILERGGHAVDLYVSEVLPRKLKLYEEYVDRRTFWLDLKLIAFTIGSLAMPSDRTDS